MRQKCKVKFLCVARNGWVWAELFWSCLPGGKCLIVIGYER